MTSHRDQAEHAATPTRIRQARAAGQIPLSRELASSLMWLGGLAIMLSLGGGLWQALQAMAVHNWTHTDLAANGQDVMTVQFRGATAFFWSQLLPVMAATAAIAAAGFAIQTRFGIFANLLQPDWSRLSPAGNLSRLGSLPNWLTAAFGVFKLAGLGFVAWWILAADVQRLLALGGYPLNDGFGQSGMFVAGLLVKLAAGVCLVGLADYGIRWWYHQHRMQMTDQEVRDERRAAEAPPEIGARRRLLDREDHSDRHG